MQMKIIITFFVIICSIGLTSINNAYAAADTWTAATTTDVGTNNMYGVSMGDASNGVAVGQSGQIVYTTNGGVDWTDATTTNVGANTMHGVSMSDASNGVAVGYTGQIVFTGTGTPSQVGTASTTAENEQVTLSWSAPAAGKSDITDYIIQYSTDDSTWSTFDDGTSTSTTATVTCLTNDTTYYFRVAAVNSSGTGDFSSSSSVLLTLVTCTTDSTSTGGGGGSQSCNSRGFGVGKSLAVYEVSYNFCGDNSSVDILAYSTCGSISAQLTTEYARSTAGLSLDQPFIDDEITVYTGILRDDIKKFTVKMENKRNSFEDTFVINECKTTKRYSQTTGYTSSQQGTSDDNGITVSVPQWVKNTAGWWAEDKISEDEFVKGIEFLVKERIIDNVKTGNVESASSAVPTWVKNNVGWWAEGQIDDNSFVKGIEYLVKVGIIQVN